MLFRASQHLLNNNCWAGLPSGSVVKNQPAKQETQVQSLGWEDPLVEEMAMNSSILAWEIPWTEEPGRLQFAGPQRVRHHLVPAYTHMHATAGLWGNEDEALKGQLTPTGRCELGGAQTTA